MYHQPGLETSEDIARRLGLANIELEYTEEDFETLTNYKLFREHIQPLLAEQNPKSPQSKVVNLIAAKWREFAQAAGQYKKSKLALSSPTIEKQNDFGDSKNDSVLTAGKQSGLYIYSFLNDLFCFVAKQSFQNLNYNLPIGKGDIFLALSVLLPSA